MSWVCWMVMLLSLLLRVDVDAEPVEEHLHVGRAGIAGQRRAGLPGELADAVLDVLDAGVASVGGVVEVDVVVDLLRVGLEECFQDRLGGHGARSDQGHGIGRCRYGEGHEGDRRDDEGPDSHTRFASFLAGYRSFLIT